MKTLKPNQVKAINKLKKYKVGALFMQAGSGKTLTAINIINSREDISRVLWFTPFRTKENLRVEIEACNLKFPVEIVGIETLSNSDKTYFELLNKYKNEKFFCVLDESLKIKNNSIRYFRINEIGKLAKYRLVLNGTPISKNYLDLFNQMNFLSPRILKMNFNQFYNTFVVEKQLLKSGNVKRKWVDSFENLEYLFNLISPFIYESDLKLNIPIEKIKRHYIIKNDELFDYYKFKNILLKRLENFKTILPTLQQLQHSYSINSGKFEALLDILKELELNRIKKDKIIIFYKYINEYEFLKEHLDSNYKILSLQKHSFGLNLQDNNVIIFYNFSWDYAVMEQAEKRIFRLGQKEKCYIYTLQSNVGLDTMIITNLDKKANLLTELKNKTIKELEELI